MKKFILRAVIIDDELATRVVLADLLKTCSSIKIAGTASELDLGIELIKKTHPDIVFLDINMPISNGFEFYKEFESLHFKIIFCTTDNQYGIKALDKSVAGYLTKPIDINKLEELIQKVSEEILNEDIVKMEDTFNNLNSLEIIGENIILDIEHGFIVENSYNIVYCYAKNSYAVLVLNNGKECLVPKSLKEIQKILPQNQFYRTHKSFIVNIYYIQKFVRGKENYVYLEGGAEIPVSVRVTSVISRDIKKILTV